MSFDSPAVRAAPGRRMRAFAPRAVSAGLLSLGLVGAASAAPAYTLIDLGDLPGGSNSSAAYGINDAGQVVGYSNAATGYRAFLWSGGTMADLGDLPGGSNYSNARGINDAGQIAATASGPRGTHAVLLTPVAEMPVPGVVACLGLELLAMGGALRARPAPSASSSELEGASR